MKETRREGIEMKMLKDLLSQGRVDLTKGIDYDFDRYDIIYRSMSEEEMQDIFEAEIQGDAEFLEDYIDVTHMGMTMIYSLGIDFEQKEFRYWRGWVQGLDEDLADFKEDHPKAYKYLVSLGYSNYLE